MRPRTRKKAHAREGRGFRRSVPLVSSLLLAGFIGCREEPPPPQSTITREQTEYVIPLRPERSKSRKGRAAAKKASSQDSLEALRGSFPEMAGILEKRVSQPEKKMKLTREQALRTASDIARLLPSMENTGKMCSALPRSCVELIRGVAERGVGQEEAEKIAGFLLEYVSHVKFRNTKQFDSNLSHVIGRDWPEIDYSGEGTSWQSRQKSWSRYGVEDFRTVKSICRYFKRESGMRYHRRIYRPKRGFPGRLEGFCE
ncbi:hypothetical protein GF318_03810 [Candidatus Micrarchaeota archaeon]|nr:hypothetical protein [Candidatus Micrarchaeota archaeon]